MSVAVIAVDGGASKTHLALLGRDGALLELVRGPESSPQNLGLERALGVLDRLFEQAGAKAGEAEVAQLNMSGVDFPSEERELREAIEARRWAERIVVDNDTFAVLRAGTERGWGVAVVCGTGINCVGVSADGRHARFPALGTITGDWGGGSDVGNAALSAAARSQDGRGPRTSLEQAVPAHFGLETPHELAEAIHRGTIRSRRLLELSPVVFAEAERDEVAAGIVERLASEIVAMARVALERLELQDERAEVLLGGGLLQGDGRLTSTVEDELRRLAPKATVAAPESPPIVGAALLGLDALGAGVDAQARAREELEAAVAAERGGDGG
jgi:N-acetylglucosamine kinase-like BadF-type ATPase